MYVFFRSNTWPLFNNHYRYIGVDSWLNGPNMSAMRERQGIANQVMSVLVVLSLPSKTKVTKGKTLFLLSISLRIEL
jgi:hypothetical protein